VKTRGKEKRPKLTGRLPRVKQKYERMLEGMQKNQKKAGKKRAEKWFLYMLKCSDATLYTGVAKDIEKRFKVHSSGKGARYTRARLPLEIVYRETCKSRTDALVREFKIKKLNPKHKRTLVEAYRIGGKVLKKAIRESTRQKKKKRGRKNEA
jgi:putative endonuclease